DLIKKYWNKEIMDAKKKGIKFDVTFPEKGSGGIFLSSFALEHENTETGIPEEEVNTNATNPIDKE
ncbi:MAG: hypothetical protein Q4F84_03605, partial [Fibrobacter sp.]|nr:hypothetical protein [Fibrobacter sp.]